MNKTSIEELEALARLFFSRARSINDTFRKDFQSAYQVSNRKANQVFPRKRWNELKDEWVLTTVNSALDQCYNSAVVRNRFTIEAIVSILQGTGIWRSRVIQLVGAQWRERRMQLPTAKEKVLTTIKNLVASHIPAEELTHKLIFKTAGLGRINVNEWFRDALLAARRELLEHRPRNGVPQPPEGIRSLVLPGGWIDIDGDVWDLRLGSGSRLKRNALRDDIADIAWPQMRDDLLEKHLTCGTISAHYEGYRYAGELLGSEVPEVRQATLERVQRAWLSYDVKPIKLEKARAALRRIFTRLCNLSTELSGIDRKQMLLISCWLYTSASVRRDSPKENFLTEREMNEAITGCLIDIKAGLDFTEAEVDLLSLSTLNRATVNAAPVVDWASALMLLLMLFTGLRRESVVKLKIGDWAEIRPGLFAVIWSHGKKREEKVAILATSVALLLNQYVQQTAKLREALGTKNVFLTRNGQGYWSARQNRTYLGNCLQGFTERHCIERHGKPFKLNCLILRRTYVTRELYVGRSIWALRLQLGHSRISTTRLYAKFDLYEHPGEVSHALDEHGRRSLTLWDRPLLLAELDSDERDHLLGLGEERHQDVGMCRSGCCGKISGGSPPPCSLCEYLVTGPEFLKAWDAERKGRELEMERLQSTPGGEHLLAQKKSQYELFRANLAFVKGENR